MNAFYPYNFYLFRIKSRNRHMHQIWDQDHRDREVCEDAVRTLDQGQETELGDGEIYNAANQGCKDLVAGDLSLRQIGRAHV